MFPSIPVIFINEKDLRDLHYCGRAKNFESIADSYILKVEWNAGQTFEQATVTELSS